MCRAFKEGDCELPSCFVLRYNYDNNSNNNVYPAYNFQDIKSHSSRISLLDIRNPQLIALNLTGIAAVLALLRNTLTQAEEERHNPTSRCPFLDALDN